jgi:hypothetical protein
MCHRLGLDKVRPIRRSVCLGGRGLGQGMNRNTKWLPAVIRLQLTLESAVLVGERQGTSLSPPRGHLHIQSQSRRRGLSHHVDSGRIHPNLCYNRNHPDVLTCLGIDAFRKQHGILRLKVRQSVNQSSTAISQEGTVTDHEYVAVHLTKCLAKTQGPKVRVNAVCPGLLLTEWVPGSPKCHRNLETGGADRNNRAVNLAKKPLMVTETQQLSRQL